MTAPRTTLNRSSSSNTHRFRSTPVSRLALVIAACCLTPLVVSGCSTASASANAASAATSTSAAALPSCQAPAASSLPHSAGSLTQANTGTYCLGVGKLLDIFLTAPTNVVASGGRWTEIKIADTSVLTYGNNGVMTSLRGETPGVIIGHTRGVTTVSSTLPGGTTWTATIVVS